LQRFDSMGVRWWESAKDVILKEMDRRNVRKLECWKV
jgi:hypothetical protein